MKSTLGIARAHRSSGSRFPWSPIRRPSPCATAARRTARSSLRTECGMITQASGIWARRVMASKPFSTRLPTTSIWCRTRTRLPRFLVLSARRGGSRLKAAPPMRMGACFWISVRTPRRRPRLMISAHRSPPPSGRNCPAIQIGRI